MANNKSAKKRIETNKRNRLRNRFYKSSLRTLTKKFLKELNVSAGSKNFDDTEKVQKTFNSIYSLIDKATKKNVFHKNNAARKKAQLIGHLKIKLTS
jgi:small subunit ribosomal protein S20